MPSGPHTVSDVMTHTVMSVGRDASFKDIVRTLEQWQVSALPVLDGAGRVVGVVSEADLLPKEEFRDSDPTRFEQMHRLGDLAKAGAVTAGELMTAPAVFVLAGAPLTQAARLMAAHRVKRLPVVDADCRLVGIVSRSDLLKVFLRPDAELAEEVRTEILPGLFPGEAAPVDADVADGIVTLTGRLRDRSLVPVLTRLVRSVEGVVDVRLALTGRDGAA